MGKEVKKGKGIQWGKRGIAITLGPLFHIKTNTWPKRLRAIPPLVPEALCRLANQPFNGNLPAWSCLLLLPATKERRKDQTNHTRRDKNHRDVCD